MTVAVDIGNTNIVVAVLNNGVWNKPFRVFTDTKKTGDEYYVIFSSLFDERGVERDKVDKVIISSVVPFLTRSIEKNMRRIFKKDPIMVSHSVECGLNKATIPPELGADLLCNMAYGHYHHKDGAVMVIDFGTALTFSTVSKEGKVLGVAIAPGLVTAVNALFGSTAQLPQVELKVPSSVLGRDSMESIRAGIMEGYSGLVEKIIANTEKELGERLYVMATGGLSSTISTLIDRLDE
ncbi:MAG: type III pantothenate kinase, partial [Candidatus Ornithospirochaeta sp.]